MVWEVYSVRAEVFQVQHQLLCWAESGKDPVSWENQGGWRYRRKPQASSGMRPGPPNSGRQVWEGWNSSPRRIFKLVVSWGILVEKRVLFPLLLPSVWSSQSVPKVSSAVMCSRKSPCLKTSALPVGQDANSLSTNKRPPGSHRPQPLFFQYGLLQISAVVKPVGGWTIVSLWNQTPGAVRKT